MPKNLGTVREVFSSADPATKVTRRPLLGRPALQKRPIPREKGFGLRILIEFCRGGSMLSPRAERICHDALSFQGPDMASGLLLLSTPQGPGSPAHIRQLFSDHRDRSVQIGGWFLRNREVGTTREAVPLPSSAGPLSRSKAAGHWKPTALGVSNRTGEPIARPVHPTKQTLKALVRKPLMREWNLAATSRRAPVRLPRGQ
jgi:hypothetical protein